MFSETRFIFTLFETSLVFMLFVLSHDIWESTQSLYQFTAPFILGLEKIQSHVLKSHSYDVSHWYLTNIQHSFALSQ